MFRIKTVTVNLPTPGLGLPLAGYSSCRCLTEADGQLRANLALLSDESGAEVVVGSVDTLFISPTFLQDLAAAGIREKIILFATHTHNAPSLSRELPLLGKVDAKWYSAVVATIAGALDTLRTQDAKSAVLAYGESVTSLNVNRRKVAYVFDYRGLRKGRFRFRKETAMAPNRFGVVDHRVRLLSFEGETGVRAIIWTFAAHAAFEPRYTAVSADFPGVVQEQLREKFGGDCCIIYLPGLAGSAIPKARQKIGISFKELLMRLLPFFPMLPSYSVRGYRNWTRSLIKKLDLAYESRVKVGGSGGLSVAERTVNGIFSDKTSGSTINLVVSHLSFGDDAGILAYSGEMLGEWMSYLELMNLGKTLISGYAGGPCLYVPPTSQLQAGGYEVDRFQEYFGLNGYFSENITEKVMMATTDLLKNGREIKH